MPPLDILTSQDPIDKWHEAIGDLTYADAILDRLVHNAHRIDLADDSLRRTAETRHKGFDHELASRQKTNRQQDALKRDNIMSEHRAT